MRRSVLICLLAFAMVFGISTSIYAADHLPATDGKAVINYITRTSPYTSWPLWPGKDKFYRGTHPHGAFLSTYVSPEAVQTISGKAGTFPDGSFVVKENYGPEKKLAAITVMYKKKNFSPESGDWFWLKYAPNGQIQKEGKVRGCINCHKAVKGNDWVFTGPVN